MEELEKLWNEFDSNEVDRLNLEKSNLCEKMLQMANGKKKEEIQLELNLLWFIFVTQKILERINEINLDKLLPYIEPFIQKCNNSTFEYYEKRSKETKSRLNKWRYSFACWLIQSKKNPIFIDEALSSLIVCSLQHMVKKEYSDTIHLLVSAFNLSRLYNITKHNSAISEAALKIFYSFANTEYARWIIEPEQVFAALNKSTDYNLINNMITILHREANRFLSKNNHHLHQSLLEVSIELCNLTNLDTTLRDKLRNEIRIMIAESHEDDANKRVQANNSMAAVHFYREAQLWYEQAGKPDKAKELNEKIRDASGKIEYNEFKTEITLPELKLDGNNGYQLVNSFCNYSENIPSLDWITDLTKDLIKQHPISTAVSNITFNKTNPVSYANDDVSILESRIRQQTIFTIRITESRLALAVKKLEEEKKLTESDFVTFLSDIGLYDNDQLTIIKSGIQDHFKGNYIASIHTIMPQIEGTIRSLLKTNGVSILKTKRDIIMDSELGSLLSNPEVMDILGKDFINYLKTKYADPDGINLRNNVSHALSPLSDFSYETSITLIHTIFKLAKLSVK